MASVQMIFFSVHTENQDQSYYKVLENEEKILLSPDLGVVHVLYDFPQLDLLSN